MSTGRVERGWHSRGAFAQCALLAALIGSATAVWAAPAAEGADFRLTVQRGDTLPDLGERWLADPRRWPELQRHNRIRDPNRLVPGSTIAIPLALLRGTRVEFAEATIRSVSGPAHKADGAPLATGGRMREGESIKTAGNGYVTLQLADGATLQLQPRSDLKLERARRLAGNAATDTRFSMQAGQLEVLYESGADKASRLEIRTDIASAAARGTGFRIAANERGTRTEAIEGAISFAGLAPNAGPDAPADALPVAEGFGAMVDATRKPIAPVRLLAAPDLPQDPVFQRTPALRLAFASLQGAVGYRARLAADADFQRMVGETVVSTPEVSFSGLEPGSYVLRVRAIDQFGLEGRDAITLIGMLPDNQPAAPVPASGWSAPKNH